MKHSRKILSKIVFIFVLLFTLSAMEPVQSQISFDDDVDDETPGAPINGLIALGLAAGAWYGIRKLKEK